MFLKLVIIISYCNLHIHTSHALQEHCLSAKTCGECISQSVDCFWCEDEAFSHIYRCNGEKQLQFHCNKEKLVGAKLNPRYETLVDREFSKKFGQTVQLKPQKYRLHMRTNSELKIPIHFQQADDYPMDLYYLMDLSCTMKKFKTNLANVGKTLADTMKRTTKDFKIGFGAFVDKPVMPFSSFKLDRIQCIDPNNPNDPNVWGEPTYSFSHKLTLDSDEKAFVSRVRSASTSGNTDSPEGTLDALMQALVCKQEIGWRDQSDKIIVVATDEEFHYAGDGKLAGILVPNDGECHMSGHNYSHYHVLDYPSMHQIAEKVRENKFNIVFTVTNKVRPIYETLANIIGSTARVDTLQDEDSTTIINLIDKVYSDIRSSVELRVERMSDFIEIDLYSKCENKTEFKTNKCTFKGRPDITFYANIRLKSCPKDRSLWDQKIKIGLANINESVEIDLRMDCECECERADKIAKNSAECHNAGTFACGICAACNGNRTGDQCECDPEKPIDPKDPEAHCKHPEITNTCSGRGFCECGKCNCFVGFSGDYCQYDDSNCHPDNDKNFKICNGNGRCLEAKCNCSKGFTGKYCDCPTDNQTCTTTTNGQQQVCSGEGKCVCGQCECNTSSQTGKYCQICPRCESQAYCDLMLSCVPKICELYGTNCTESCDRFDYKLVDKLTDLMANNTDGLLTFVNQCRNRTLNNECDISFTYERTDDEINKRLSFKITKLDKSCAEKVNLVVVSGSVISGIILVGLALLLIWKLIAEILDRKEFARFQQELSKANWEQSENPLYKEAKSTFTNPTFGLREKSMKRISRLTDRISRRFDFNK